MTHPSPIGPAPEEDHANRTDPIRGLAPLEAAETAQRMAVDPLRTGNAFHADAVALTVRHATIAVGLHEQLENGRHTSIEHLLAFFSEPGYRQQVLALRTNGHSTVQPGQNHVLDSISVGADWLPYDTRSFFEHVYYGAWTEALRDDNAATAALALTMAMHREIMKGGN